MEQLMTDEGAVQAAADNALHHLGNAGVFELTCAFALPVLALLIARLINRVIDARKTKSLHASILDWSGPLIAPLLAIILLTATGYTLRGLDYELHVLPFIWKLAVAWFAVQLVSLVSSRQGTGWLVVLVIVPITLLHLFDVWDPVVHSLSNMKFAVGDAKFNAYGVLKSIAALIALFWIAGFLVTATDARLRRIRRIHVSNRVLIMKIFQIVLYFMVFLIGLQILGVSLTALSVLGGALGVGIGFGLQKIASNFISGIILLFEKSVSVDDMIQLEDGTTGFIRQNAARYTRVELSDGRDIMIPNEEFITNRITTFTHRFKRGQINLPLLLHFDTDIDLALKLLVKAASNHPGVMKDPAPGAYVTGFEDNGIRAQLLLWLEDIAGGTFGARTAIIKDIQRLFRENGVVIAYPHQVAANDRWGKSINDGTEPQQPAAGKSAQQQAKKSRDNSTDDAKEKKTPGPAAKK